MPGKRGEPHSPQTGRYHAERRYRVLGMCEHCGLVPATERHHVDGDTFNNERPNVAFLCNRCHQTVDGRLSSRDPSAMIAAAAVARRARTHCVHGHPLSGDNLYVGPSGKRACRACARTRALAYLRRKRSKP